MSEGRAVARLAASLFGLRQTDEAKLEAHARRRARELAIDPRDYVQRLAADPVEQSRLAVVATNGWTWFWREIDALLEACRRLASRRGPGPVHAWVAGCSTGEEAFTLAMVALQSSLDITVLGTDVDATRIERAREGRYGEHALRCVPPRLRDELFVREGDDVFRPVDAVRSRVRFETHNLLSPPPRPPAGSWDLVCCRNVLLYTEPAAARRMLTNLGSVLDPMGERVLAAADELTVDARRIARAARQESPPRPVPRGAERPSEPSETAPAPPAAPGPPPEYAHALAAVGRRDLPAATRSLEKLLRRIPEHFDTWLLLGNVCAASHRLEEAHHAYARAEALDPKNAELLLMQGLLCRKRGDPDGAESALRRALFLEPDLWLGWLLLAGIHERSDRAPDARRALKAALRGVTRRPRLQWRVPAAGIPDRDVDSRTAEWLCRAQLGTHRREAREK